MGGGERWFARPSNYHEIIPRLLNGRERHQTLELVIEQTALDENMVDALKRTKWIDRLEIHSFSYYHDISWLEEVLENPAITELYLSGIYNTKSSKARSSLIRSRYLKRLIVGGGGLIGVNDICYILRHNTHLWSFMITHCTLDDYCAERFCSVLYHQNTLRHISFGTCRNEMTDNGLTSIIEALEHNTSILSFYGFNGLLIGEEYTKRNRRILSSCQRAVRCLIWSGRYSILGKDVSNIIARLLWETRRELIWENSATVGENSPKKLKVEMNL